MGMAQKTPWRTLRQSAYFLIGLTVPASYLAWKTQAAESLTAGAHSPQRGLDQHAQNYFIGDLGGMKVHIQKYCAEHVEYDVDPGFGERRKGPEPERTVDSRLRSFGIDARFPEMECKQSKAMQEDYRHQFLNQNNNWVSIGINAGEIYPGAEAANRHAGYVKRSIEKPTEFWFENYERIPELIYGLDAYVVKGIDPYSGSPARESEKTNDKFFSYDKSGAADTYISCSKTNVSGGVSTCAMKFSMEPTAKALVNIRFARSLLPQWRNIRQSTIDLLTSFATPKEDLVRSARQSSNRN